MQEKTLPKPKIRTSNIYTTEFSAISYDIFGSPYQKTGSFLADNSLDFGYLGKPYNADTELYDYGFRDYSPTTARFTTVDPIRDGRNWYSYVVNDPVNYVDLWGLSEVIIGVSTSDDFWGTTIGQHVFVMYIDNENSQNSIMLDASGSYGGGRTSDIVDNYQIEISIESYLNYFDTNEILTTFTLELSETEKQNVKNEIERTQGRTWMQCARMTSELIINTNIVEDFDYKNTPKGVLNELLKYKESYPDKLDVKQYSFKTKEEIENEKCCLD